MATLTASLTSAAWFMLLSPFFNRVLGCWGGLELRLLLLVEVLLELERLALRR